MKDIKYFFKKNNRLNKGYEAQNNRHNAFDRKKLELLPPIDVLETYENLYPGFVEKMFKAFEAEQKHRHAIEQTHLRIYSTTKRMGLFCGVFTSIAICYVSFKLFMLNMPLQALAFTSVGFGTICIVSLLSYLKLQKTNRERVVNQGYNKPRR